MAELRSLECPSCGAPLKIQEGQGLVICKFCGDTIQLTNLQATPKPREPEASRPVIMIQQTPTFTAPPSTQTVARPRARSSGAAGGGCTAVIFLLAFLFVGGVLVFSGAVPLPANLQLLLQGVVPLNMTVFSGSMLVPSTDDALPEIVTLAQNNSSADLERMIVKIGSDGKMVWRAEPLAEASAYLYPKHMASAEGVVYVAVADTLFAYRLGDGTTIWQASLSDSLHPNCVDCLQLLAGYVVVLSSDGRVQGFDAQTGEDRWSRELDASGNDMYRIGGAAVVFDADDAGSALFFLDPATGAVTRRLTSTCTRADGFFSSDLDDYGTTLLYDEPTEALYLIFGSFEGCVQRWDPSADAPQWEAHLTEEDGFSSSYALTPLIEGSTLYLGTDNGHVWAFDTTTDDWRTLIAEDDTRLTVLGAVDGVVVLQVVETRGSADYALWGVDATSGEVLWKVDLDKAEPLLDTNTASGILSSGESAWVARVVNAGVVLVQAKSEPHQLIIQGLDARTGTPNTETVVPLTRLDPSFFYSASLIAWRASRVWLLIDNHIYLLNTETATVDYIWP